MIYNESFYIVFSSEWTLALTGFSGKRPSVFHDESKRQPPAFFAEVTSQTDGNSLRSIDRYQFLNKFCTLSP